MDANLHLDWCSYKAAEFAVKHWHYSKSMPSGKLIRIGCWENGRYIGCVLYGRGANKSIGSPYGLIQTEVCELVRVALREHQAPTSQILAKSIKMLKRKCPGLRLIVSYADLNQKHLGIIYQATNWIYEGYKPIGGSIVVHGRIRHARTFNSKYGNSSIEWLRKHVDPKAHKIHDAGRHKYLMPLDKKIKKRLLSISRPYPKQILRV